MFKQFNTISGELETRESRGSATVEFLRGNFDGETLNDVVYTTGNPQLQRHEDEINVEFHNVLNVWLENGWDEEEDTVLPETMAARGLEMVEKYPNKRHIIHFIQPHYPFIRTGTQFDLGHLSNSKSEEEHLWGKLMKGELSISESRIEEIYHNNLQEALPEVAKLVSNINGKTVITSDHGNMLGERAYPVPIQEWGHPRGIYTSNLVTVPWFICDYQKRRRIISEDGQSEDSSATSEEVTDKLEALGYRD